MYGHVKRKLAQILDEQTIPPVMPSFIINTFSHSKTD